VVPEGYLPACSCWTFQPQKPAYTATAVEDAIS